MTDFQEPGTNTGSVFEAKFPKLGPSKIVKNTRIGKASDFWNLYEKDIKLAADLGKSHSILIYQALSLSHHGMKKLTSHCTFLSCYKGVPESYSRETGARFLDLLKSSGRQQEGAVVCRVQFFPLVHRVEPAVSPERQAGYGGRQQIQ